MTRETVTERVEIKFCNVKVSVDMMKIEFWNSDESSSKVYYEPWNMVSLMSVYFSKYELDELRELAKQLKYRIPDTIWHD